MSNLSPGFFQTEEINDSKMDPNLSIDPLIKEIVPLENDD